MSSPRLTVSAGALAPNMEPETQFSKTLIHIPDAFARLSTAITFEALGKGRAGAVVVECDRGAVPIVRTTTSYALPAQRFCDIHALLCTEIRRAFDDPRLAFNNAMCEVYDEAYCKMGFHSDQGQDLQPGSFIALFSCYSDDEPAEGDLRKLVVQNKATAACRAVTLDPCSVVLFSTESNARHLHKIVLDSAPHMRTKKTRWLGVTLRLSKTFVTYDVRGAWLQDGRALRLANLEERRRVYALKGQENATDAVFVYSDVDYTISPSDLLAI